MRDRYISRRDLIKAASGAASWGLASSLFPGARLTCAASELQSSPALLATSQLKRVALHVIESARALGAQFADVRVELHRTMSVTALSGGRTSPPFLFDTAEVGVRAVVDGSWGFAGGHGHGLDDVRALAGLAVERAKAARNRRPKPFEFAAAPVVSDGAWQTPIDIDPFTVPIGEQETLFLDAVRAAERSKSAKGRLRSATARMVWMKSERVFASTEGSFTAQRTHAAVPGCAVSAVPMNDDTMTFSLQVSAVRQGGYGYEAASKVGLQDAFHRTAEEALRAAAVPLKSVDVGRYDLVLAPSVVAEILVDTVGRALELDRARGDKANSAGTSYAMPPAETLGVFQLGSKLLTVTGDRSRPHANATVGWDEEGVAPEDFTLVQDGIVVDYITTRPTAPSIAAWYASRKKEVRSHGCATRTGTQQPILQLPNLTIRPEAGNADVDDLIRGVKRGYYVREAVGGVDQQCLNGQYGGVLVYEVTNGKVGGIARDMAFQFNTPQFWKSLEGLGGAASASLEHISVDGMSANLSHVGVHCPPALFRRVNVINTGRQA